MRPTVTVVTSPALFNHSLNWMQICALTWAIIAENMLGSPAMVRDFS